LGKLLIQLKKERRKKELMHNLPPHNQNQNADNAAATHVVLSVFIRACIQ